MAEFADAGIVDMLLAVGASTEVSDEEDGRTPLLNSIHFGLKRITKLLVNSGANVNICDE